MIYFNAESASSPGPEVCWHGSIRTRTGNRKSLRTPPQTLLFYRNSGKVVLEMTNTFFTSKTFPHHLVGSVQALSCSDWSLHVFMLLPQTKRALKCPHALCWGRLQYPQGPSFARPCMDILEVVLIIVNKYKTKASIPQCGYYLRMVVHCWLLQEYSGPPWRGIISYLQQKSIKGRQRRTEPLNVKRSGEK